MVNYLGYIPSPELTYPSDKAYLKMIFLFPRWDTLISWSIILSYSIFVKGTFHEAELAEHLRFCTAQEARQAVQTKTVDRVLLGIFVGQLN